MNLPTGFPAGFPEGFQKAFPVPDIQKDRFPPVPAIHHMKNHPTYCTLNLRAIPATLHRQSEMEKNKNEGPTHFPFSGPAFKGGDDDDLEMDCPALKDGDVDARRQPAAPRQRMNLCHYLGLTPFARFDWFPKVARGSQPSPGGWNRIVILEGMRDCCGSAKIKQP